MNSLNILSGRSTSPPPSPFQSRAPSDSAASIQSPYSEAPTGASQHVDGSTLVTHDPSEMSSGDAHSPSLTSHQDDTTTMMDEKASLLAHVGAEDATPVTGYATWMVTRYMPGAISGAFRFFIAATLAPGRYLIACFYDDEGQYSPLMPVYHVARTLTRKKRKPHLQPVEAMDASDKDMSDRSISLNKNRGKRMSSKRSISLASSSAITSDSEIDSERPSTRDGDYDAPSLHTRSRSANMAGEEIAPAKRSIRIKLHNEELQERKRKSQARKKSNASQNPHLSPEEAAAVLKSPTSPATSSKSKFPRAPLPPRPLVPRRQPSYSTAGLPIGPHQKTLILDLDETLIHSQVKGGRFTTGHMVEVKLQQPIGVGGVTLGPTVPILYYVNKRPHCDEFLRKVSKWYNLVIFTASMQEYADPVIDWLEAECKYFTARYYRQHCTARGASYIKDLSQVEPDLSKVMILDNSPICYAFHPDNAIPIDGWTSDPTDNDLLYLIPLLEGLQYVTDVRALLGLRLGQPESV